MILVHLFFRCCLSYLVILLLLSAFAHADQNDSRLVELFRSLKSTENLSTASVFETKIWHIWMEHYDPEVESAMFQGVEAMKLQQFEQAFGHFSLLIKLAPNYAEGWNKRATVLYLMGKYELSQADIDKVLVLEKRHFGALSGQGLVQTALNNYQKAIDSYIEAHKVHPNMKSPLIMIEKLKLQIKKESI